MDILQVAVAVGIQAACMANAPGKPLEKLLRQRRQLPARGYKTAVVVFTRRHAGSEMQQMYLRMRFREAGVVLPAK